MDIDWYIFLLIYFFFLFLNIDRRVTIVALKMIHLFNIQGATISHLQKFSKQY